MSADESSSRPETDDCPLPLAAQQRNSLIYGLFWCLFYFAAPITYVGNTHANLLKQFTDSDITANLPHAFYQWFTACPILVAWFLPQPKVLRPLIVGALSAMTLAAALVAGALWLRSSASLVVAATILFGTIFGAANGILVTAMWEVVRRGTSSRLRGRTMSLAFGIGPLFACAGSVLQQMVMNPEPFRLTAGISIPTFGLGFPLNYLAMFSAGVPVLALATLLGTQFVLPAESAGWPADRIETHHPGQAALRSLTEFFTHRPVLFASLAYLLVYSGGNAIFDNVSLHARDVLGDEIEDTQGIQSFLRFSFKSVTGLCLGWLLARTSPRAPVLATTALLLIGIAWVLGSSGYWYLLSAGLLGAGELFGAYFPNYVVSASSKSTVRANVALLNLLGSFVGFASVGYGLISEAYGRTATFFTAGGLLILSVGLILATLPPRPTAPDEPSEVPAAH
ncbi:MAG: hypothetical protein ACK5WR_18245 [Planctomycetaceae bacterium]|jgi:hypothetical protein